MKRKRPEPPSVSCPTPSKALYRTATEAQAAILVPERRGRRTPLKAYRCRCGFWHLASEYD